MRIMRFVDLGVPKKGPSLSPVLFGVVVLAARGHPRFSGLAVNNATTTRPVSESTSGWVKSPAKSRSDSPILPTFAGATEGGL